MIQRLCTLYFVRKRLILLKKDDLSTEKNAFTITTIFIYRSIVNRQKKRKSGDISQKQAKTVKKKSTATARRTAKPSSRNQLDANVRERTALVIAQLRLPSRESCMQITTNMSLQQDKTRFLLAGVDNCLHIHRMRCGKSRSLSTSQFLSQTSPP